MPTAHLLLADDHTVVRAGLRNALQGLPEIEIVGEVGNGKELMTALANQSVDLLVMDANMPDFEPVSAVKQIKSEYTNLKILIVSAFDDETYVVGLLKAGVNGYHLKDQPLADLQLAVQRILNGERWITSSLVTRLTERQTPPLSLSSAGLTRRQRELLRLLTQGTDNRNIALALNISVKTVENHLTALYRMLSVDSRLKAVNYALQHPELFAVSGQEMIAIDPLPRSGENALTILVVDDNPRYRQQLCRIIGKISPAAIIYEADNTADALHIGEKIQPKLGLIDVVLEEEDGILCASRLKSLSPLTRLVLISAYPDREFRRRALAAGAVAFLDKKDLDTESVRQVVEDTIR